jgi:hypothetical protein
LSTEYRYYICISCVKRFIPEHPAKRFLAGRFYSRQNAGIRRNRRVEISRCPRSTEQGFFLKVFLVPDPGDFYNAGIEAACLNGSSFSCSDHTS